MQAHAPLQDVRKEARAAARSKTASSGAGWFDMKAQVITPEVKRDWRLLRLRSAYDPRHFYKVRSCTQIWCLESFHLPLLRVRFGSEVEGNQACLAVFTACYLGSKMLDKRHVCRASTAPRYQSTLRWAQSWKAPASSTAAA